MRCYYTATKVAFGGGKVLGQLAMYAFCNLRHYLEQVRGWKRNRSNTARLYVSRHDASNVGIRILLRSLLFVTTPPWGHKPNRLTLERQALTVTYSGQRSKKMIPNHF